MNTMGAGSKAITHLKDLTADPTNARRHNPRNVGMIEDALHEVGAARSIVIDEGGRVLAGNATMEAAAAAGIEKVQVVDADGATLIAVRRTGLTEQQKRRLALFDNRAAELAEWDAEMLAGLLTEDALVVDGLFTDKELNEIGAASPSPPATDAEAQLDRAAALQEQWQVNAGDVWEIPSLTVSGGVHRVVCGDCTDRAVVERCMQGEMALMMVTDPPYGVEYDPSWRDELVGKDIHRFKYPNRSVSKVVNDNRNDWSAAYQLFPGDVAYVWHGALFTGPVLAQLEAAGFVRRAMLIWRKPNFVISRGDYHWQHESLWYCVRHGKKSQWKGDRTQSTIWDIASLQPMGRSYDSADDQTGHSTQKPVECMARPIRNHDAPLIYDPFLGSGTTLVACEREGRLCRGIEIFPAYVAVILQRLTDSGLRPQLLKPR